jgi:hypothetical protein
MNPKRWGQIERLYHAALEREPKDRGKFLDEACDGDTELRRELESLLAHGIKTETFLEKPELEFAAPVLADDHGLHKSKDVRPNPRPPWWMYVIAGAFLARALFITYFCFLGPESMGIDVRPTKTYPVVQQGGSTFARGQGRNPTRRRSGAGGRPPIADVNYWYWFLCNVETARSRRARNRTASAAPPRCPAVKATSRPVLVHWTRNGSSAEPVQPIPWIWGLRSLWHSSLPGTCLRASAPCVLAIYSTAVFLPFDGFTAMARGVPVWYQVLLWPPMS